MESVLERFLRYVQMDTQSDEDSESVPSTAKQLALADMLAQELSQAGLAGVRRDEFGYVYGWLPATPGQEGVPCLGLIAHMDTSPSAPGANVKPRVVSYGGGDITLGHSVSITRRDFPALERYVGQDLIVTDGATLLGADDKAGVAEIVSAAAYLAAHPEIPHGKLAVAFTPDEEVGRGADHFDVEGFGAAAAYTVDGGELGELEYENFNAASARFTVHGVNIHPGSAKNKMKNASLMAVELAGMFPPAETPAHTEGYEGFYHLQQMSGDETTAHLSYLIRDHDRERFESRKEFVQRVADYLNGKYGRGTVELELTDSYYNMREPLEPHMYLIHQAKAAFARCGVEAKVQAIRGGTDGARLTYMGLPCPNLSTGGVNFHSIHEFIPVSALETMTAVLVELARRDI